MEVQVADSLLWLSVTCGGRRGVVGNAGPSVPVAPVPWEGVGMALMQHPWQRHSALS